MPTYPTANREYTRSRKEIDALIKMLQNAVKAIDRTRNGINATHGREDSWAYVGDVRKIACDLVDVVAFAANKDADEIRDLMGPMMK